MRDCVFIGWSESQIVAIEVKKILEEYNFEAIVGGNYSGNNPSDLKGSTINDKITKQIERSDQTILIFNKRHKVIIKKDENRDEVGYDYVSPNLIYELGFATSFYKSSYKDDTSERICVFTINDGDSDASDYSLFPSDVHGMFNQSISTSKDIKDLTVEEAHEIAKCIVDAFLDKQKGVKNINKIKLMDNYSIIENELKYHFRRSTMSDYDFATSLLVYAISSYCFHRQYEVKRKIANFKALPESDRRAIDNPFFTEALNFAELTVDFFCSTIPTNESKVEFSLTIEEFRSILNRYKNFAERILKEVFGVQISSPFMRQKVIDKRSATRDFVLGPDDYEKVLNNECEAMTIALCQQEISYLVLILLNSTNISHEDYVEYCRRGIPYCINSAQNFEIIKKVAENREFSMLCQSYSYRNLAQFCEKLVDNDKSLSEDDKEKYEQLRADSIEKSINIRKELMDYVNNGNYSSALKDYISLEYYYQLIDVVDYYDQHDREAYLREIESFLREKGNRDLNALYTTNILKNKIGEIRGKKVF